MGKETFAPGPRDEGTPILKRRGGQFYVDLGKLIPEHRMTPSVLLAWLAPPANNYGVPQCPAAERRYSSSIAEDTNSGTPLGASCSAVGSGRALRTAFGTLPDFLTVARFAGLRALLVFFFDFFAVAFRDFLVTVFFAAVFLTFRFSFLAIALSLKRPRQTLPGSANI
jgi:hypothetical protein